MLMLVCGSVWMIRRRAAWCHVALWCGVSMSAGAGVVLCWVGSGLGGFMSGWVWHALLCSALLCSALLSLAPMFKHLVVCQTAMLRRTRNVHDEICQHDVSYHFTHYALLINTCTTCSSERFAYCNARDHGMSCRNAMRRDASPEM